MKEINKLDTLFDYLNFRKIDMEIYKFLLVKKVSTVKQIKDNLSLSEKTARTHLNKLRKLGFIKRKIMEEGKLKYVYCVENVSTGWKNLKNKIQGIVKEIGV